MPQLQCTEEGLQHTDELVQTYTHSCSWFLGPFYHLVRLFHPDYVKPLLMAPGGATHMKLDIFFAELLKHIHKLHLPLCHLRAASITKKDDLIYGHLRPWLGEFSTLKSIFDIDPCAISPSLTPSPQGRVCW